MSLIQSTTETITWIDALTLGVAGRGWPDPGSPYSRLPSHARSLAPRPVWTHSRHSAGLGICFTTDSGSLSARWHVGYRVRVAHMPLTGLAGVDLYALSPQGFRWVATGFPGDSAQNESLLFCGKEKKQETFMLYLPLFVPVKRVEIGIDKHAAIAPHPIGKKENLLPLCFYGTSLTQGASASRPGMAYPAIVGRWARRPIINLGFSSCGRMEVELAHILAELEVSLYVLDCMPNMTAEMIVERTVPFVRALKEKRPDTPILLCECVRYQNAWFLKERLETYMLKNLALKEQYRTLTEDLHYRGLHYLKEVEFMASDTECSVNNHATDLGMMRYARAVFRNIIRNRIIPLEDNLAGREVMKHE